MSSPYSHFRDTIMFRSLRNRLIWCSWLGDAKAYINLLYGVRLYSKKMSLKPSMCGVFLSPVYNSQVFVLKQHPVPKTSWVSRMLCLSRFRLEST
jgi:hypothetical protein